MVWRTGQSSYSVGRFLMRHRLYIFGTFAWILTASLVVTGMKWTPHAQGEAKHAPAKIITVKKPQVAGAETTAPATPTPTPAPTPTPTPAPTPASKPLSQVASVVNLIASSSSGSSSSTEPPVVSLLPTAPVEPNPTTTTPTTDPTTPANPPVDPTPTPTPTPDPTPTPTPTPTPVPATPTCTVDASLGFGIFGNSAVTIAAGGTSALQTLTTSDTSSVTWEPGSAVQWSDGTTTDATAPVKLVLAYAPSTIVGSSVNYTVQALASAAPGLYSLSWRVTDITRSICYDTSVQVTVVPAI